MRLLFCGVRGSTSAPGAEFVRVGGHTSCVALAHDDGPWIARCSTRAPASGASPTVSRAARSRAAVLLTHLHWDHVQGLPFFAAGDRDDSHVRVFMPEQTGPDGQRPRRRRRARARDEPAALSRSVPKACAATGASRALKPGSHHDRGLRRDRVRRSRTRVGAPSGTASPTARASIAYIPDHCPQPVDDARRSRASAQGVDLLVHDAQFLAARAGGRRPLRPRDRRRRDRARPSAAGPAGWRCSTTRPARRDDDVDAIGRAVDRDRRRTVRRRGDRRPRGRRHRPRNG